MNISITNTKLTKERRVTTIIAILILAVILIIPMSMYAQNVIPLTSTQGLRNSQVRDIYQDSRENVWIGTQDGLFRYDGAIL